MLKGITTRTCPLHRTASPCMRCLDSMTATWRWHLATCRPTQAPRDKWQTKKGPQPTSSQARAGGTHTSRDRTGGRTWCHCPRDAWAFMALWTCFSPMAYLQHTQTQAGIYHQAPQCTDPGTHGAGTRPQVGTWDT